MKLLTSLLSFFLITNVLPDSPVCRAVERTLPDPALLYEITGPGLKKPSYLFGTIHLICEKDMFSSERMMAYLEKTEQLILEMDIGDTVTMQRVLAASRLADGKSIKDYVSAAEYAQLDKLFKEYAGVPFAAMDRLKPMMSSSFILSSPKILGCQPPVIYDSYLRQAAAKRHIPIVGLETPEEQIAVMDSNSLDTQITDLKKTAQNPEARIAEFQKIVELYLDQNSDELYRFTEKQFEGSGLAAEKMLHSRNERWIPLIEKSIKAKPTFIAVGAAHLGGKRGVVDLLRGKGYKLEPIRF